MKKGVKKNIILALLIFAITAAGYTWYATFIDSFSMTSEPKNEMKMDMESDMGMGTQKMMDMEGAMEREMGNMHEKHGGHEHTPVPTDDYEKRPSIDLEASYDGFGGINLLLETENFSFAPLDVNSIDVPGEGHAHLYINGEKITRIYANHHYVSSKYLPLGENELRVELNANTHGNYTLGGENIQDTVMVEVAPRPENEGGGPW